MQQRETNLTALAAIGPRKTRPVEHTESQVGLCGVFILCWKQNQKHRKISIKELNKKTSTLPSGLYTVTCETFKYAVIYPWFSFLTIFILYVKQQMQHFCSKAIQKNSQRQNVPWSINGSTSSIHAQLLCYSFVTLTKTRRRGCAKDKDTKKQKTKTIHKMLLFKMDLPKCIQPFTGLVDSVGLLDFHHWML